MIKFIKKLFVLSSKQKKRIIKNIYSGISAESIQIFVQFFFAPLMLLFWGVENFGIWLFLLSIPNIFLVFNINMADAAIQEITRASFDSMSQVERSQYVKNGGKIIDD